MRGYSYGAGLSRFAMLIGRWAHQLFEEAFIIVISAGLTIIQARGEPFKLQAPDHSVVFVSSRKLIKEVDMAASSSLSLYAATKQVN